MISENVLQDREFNKLVKTLQKTLKKWKKNYNLIIFYLLKHKANGHQIAKYFKPAQAQPFRNCCKKLCKAEILSCETKGKREVLYEINWTGLIVCIYAKFCIVYKQKFEKDEFRKHLPDIVGMLKSELVAHYLSNINLEKANENLASYTIHLSYKESKLFLKTRGERRNPSNFLIAIHEFLERICNGVIGNVSTDIFETTIPELKGAEAYLEMMDHPFC